MVNPLYWLLVLLLREQVRRAERRYYRAHPEMAGPEERARYGAKPQGIEPRD